jgi:oligopeptide/dipeptide ABC transporter ATP-binding protein
MTEPGHGTSPGQSTQGVLEINSEQPATDDVLLTVENLDVHFGGAKSGVHAVRSVSYQVRRGETLGIVGESGSGKSVTSMAVMGLLPKTAHISGSVKFRGKELLGSNDKAMSAIRGKRIAMIFQDPMTSLDPVYKIGHQIAETLKVHNSDMSRAQLRERTVELLDIVGIPNASERVDDFPHQFSGGMRQRVVIAIAMANNPDVIIADEPTTALDVTVQATVLEAIKAAQKETGAALVLITHDLGVIAGMADRVLVMYAGRAVEIGTVDDVFYRPRMPYTVGLLNSLPRMDTDEKMRLTPIIGSPPSLQNLPAGCPFSPRCPLHIPECSAAEPPLVQVEGASLHLAACIRSDELKGQDRYEAGQVFEATSADDVLPAAFSGDIDFDAVRVGGENDEAFRPMAQTPSPLGDAAELQDPTATPAAERPTQDGDTA